MSEVRPRTRLLLGFVALLAAFGIAACGDDDDERWCGDAGWRHDRVPAARVADGSLRVAGQADCSRPKVEELCPDCEILYQNAEQDAAKQQQQVEAAITEGVDVLVLDPVDSTTAGALATRAKDAGIPVVSYDRLILDADIDYYAAFDSTEVGQQQGTALVGSSTEDGVSRRPDRQDQRRPKDNNAKLFKEGSSAVFEEEGVEVAQEYDTPDWLPENAQREMEQAITAVGEDGFAGVYAANDGTAGGAIAAMKAAGIDPSSIPVTGQDAELAAIQRIIAGEQYMTVYKPIKPLAEAAAEIAVALGQRRGGPRGPAQRRRGQRHGAGPNRVTETVPVTIDEISDTIIADDYWSVDDICTADYADACKDAGIS